MGSNVESAICYLCQSQQSSILSTSVSEAPGSAIYRCAKCSLVYLFPIMTPTEETEFYQSQFDKYMKARSGNSWETSASHFRNYQPEGERRLALIRPHLQPEDRVLEIGSATGYFLEDLRGYVKEAVGVEPNPGQREFANQRGIITKTSLEEWKGNTFDVICFYYVLEHLRDPIGYLKSLTAFLKPGGRIVIEVPNVDDILLGPYAIPNFPPFYWQKMHYYNFSKISLSHVLEKSELSFTLSPVQRYDLSNHMVWMMEGKPGGAGRFKELFTPALEAAYADMLRATWKCDTLMAVATQRS